MTKYQLAKLELKEIAEYAKNMFKGDKPAIRMVINDSIDDICEEQNLSEHKKELMYNYACKLHPKN